MHQRLLAVDMFAGRQSPCHHRCMMMIRRIHDHRIKFIQVLFKHLTVIGELLCLRKLPADVLERIGIHIAQECELHLLVALQLTALHAANAADTNVQHTHNTVLIRRRAHGERWQRHGRAKGCGLLEEGTPRSGTGFRGTSVGAHTKSIRALRGVEQEKMTHPIRPDRKRHGQGTPVVQSKI